MSSDSTTTPHPVHLKNITQIAITVSDLPRAKAFYKDQLDLTLLYEFGSMAFFQCGTVRLLIGTPEPGKPISNGGTILYFKVDDLPATHAHLQELGIPALQPPHLVAKMPDHDLWLAIVTDPDNNPIGLMSEVRAAA